eukprot:TRINITY_DN4327_c0_g1::TRINITY_DN4327_c0_g1_i1::g.21236::m.21236 TRINITY_DN4327_c0_g1::TRINITY_DN4327_c0_g1_i1::g.21236  ORF type:complete len:194 (-),score=7.60,Cytochrom_B_N/PF00033.14/0.14 TRINITY_DN4327_c0_g1_i1:384-965(-)
MIGNGLYALCALPVIAMIIVFLYYWYYGSKHPTITHVQPIKATQIHEDTPVHQEKKPQRTQLMIMKKDGRLVPYDPPHETPPPEHIPSLKMDNKALASKSVTKPRPDPSLKQPQSYKSIQSHHLPQHPISSKNDQPILAASLTPSSKFIAPGIQKSKESATPQPSKENMPPSSQTQQYYDDDAYITEDAEYAI